MVEGDGSGWWIEISEGDLPRQSGEYFQQLLPITHDLDPRHGDHPPTQRSSREGFLNFTNCDERLPPRALTLPPHWPLELTRGPANQV
jgi:hypothetical protein